MRNLMSSPPHVYSILSFILMFQIPFLLVIAWFGSVLSVFTSESYERSVMSDLVRTEE